MAGGLLSLKWNHHKSTFLHVLSSIRTKECYSDVTIACDGKFYPVHKLVLSTCSEYFEQIFDRTQCKHPVVVLKDVQSEDLEALLNYMYIGEVNVLQDKLSSLIKAAEGLRIKGLAVADEDPTQRESSGHKRSSQRDSGHSSPQSKRRRREDHDSYRDEQQPRRRRDDSCSRLSSEDDGPDKKDSQVVNKSLLSEASPVTVPMSSPDGGGASNASEDVNIIPPGAQTLPPDPTQARDAVNEILLEEAGVKEEPPDEYAEAPTEDQDSKDFFLHENLDDYDNEQPDYSPDTGAGGGSSMSAPIQSPMQKPSTSSGGWDDGVSGPSQSENSSGMVPHFQEWQIPTTSLIKSTTQYSSMHHSPLYDYNHYQCTICSVMFETCEGFTVHMKVEHQDNKPFKCQLCSYSCSRKWLLSTHMRTHTGEKPYSCPICPHKSSQSCNLLTHIKVCHGKQGRASLFSSRDDVK